jgi:hypothetical protein
MIVRYSWLWGKRKDSGEVVRNRVLALRNRHLRLAPHSRLHLTCCSVFSVLRCFLHLRPRCEGRDVLVFEKATTSYVQAYVIGMLYFPPREGWSSPDYAGFLSPSNNKLLLVMVTACMLEAGPSDHTVHELSVGTWHLMAT